MAVSLDNLGSNELSTFAAVYLATKGGTVDWECAAQLVGSKSVHAMRERVRRARMKLGESGQGQNGGPAPVGGVNKKSPSKVTPSTPRKAQPPKKAETAKAPATAVKNEDEDDLLV